ncbi:PD40 domain-containing protein [Bythopirellula polymerisocia]|nr:PD40 domain-containing protein [Bythopirellula polymerisocia]
MNPALYRLLLVAFAFQTLFICEVDFALAGPPVKLNGPLVAGGNVSEHVSIFSPDGSRVFYVADQDTLGVPELFSVPSGGGAPVKLNIPLASGVAADFLVNPDSPHVYYRDKKTIGSAGIFSVPIVGGPSVNLSGSLETLNTMGNPCDGYLSAPDQCTFFAESYPQGILLSPDGRLLIYATNNIYSVSTTGGIPTLVASGATRQAAITADGSRIVYQQYSGNGQQLHSVPIGGGLSVHLNIGSGVGGTTLSSDGSSIIYGAPLESGWAILSVPTAGGTSVQLNGPYVASGTNYYRDFQMQFSADGDRVVYRVDQDTLGRYELYSVPSSGGTPIKLNGPLKSGSVGPFFFPSFFALSPDGSRVLYTAAQDKVGVSDLYIVPIAGGTPLKLNAPLGVGGRVDRIVFTPDSKRVVYLVQHEAGAALELWSVPSTGGTPVRLNGPLVAGGNVAAGYTGSFGVSPDSSRYVYGADQEINDFNELYIVPTSGGAPVKLSEGLEVNYFNTEFSPDGGRVLFETVQKTGVPREIYSRVVREHWNAGDGIWDTAANWIYGELPDEVMQVTITGSANVTATGNPTARTVNELCLGGGAGSSTLTLATNAALTAINGVAIESNGILAGSGSIVGSVVNTGIISPGESPGTLIIDGDYTQHAAGQLQIELASAASFDKLVVAGDASLAGTLAVSLAGGFVPASDQTFDILDWGTLAGTFHTLLLPALSGQLTWNTSQLYVSGVLSVNSALPGDFDLDGDVDGRDFLAWQRNPAAGSLAIWQSNYPSASPGDFDVDGDVDGRNFLAWQRSPSIGNLADWQANYSTGSQLAGNVSVPEPSTLAIVALVVLPVICCRRHTLQHRFCLSV